MVQLRQSLLEAFLINLPKERFGDGVLCNFTDILLTVRIQPKQLQSISLPQSHDMTFHELEIVEQGYCESPW